ncbi:DUF4307 domain-containing protein [Cellulomonas sp. URHE0023]|uniref:DUF4307 domain-containing protein n=1 Tax=Cellulomonas sp. URHE0023 TaxID=1380354 RepID=UPI0009DE93CA|nr:DUF4307 domain-containing protein [Cellulomonas sp. URHE0023]
MIAYAADSSRHPFGPRRIVVTVLQPPPGRYGPPSTPRTRRRRRVGLIVTAVAGLAVALGVALNVASQPVSWKDVGFHVQGPEAIQVTFDVTKPRADTVVCTVRALSESYAEVGVRAVTVGPADEGTQRVTATVQTTELAVSGTVDRCDVTP